MVPRRLLFAAFAAWTISVAIGLLCRAPLTSDEAAYALIARGDGEAWLYRSRGVVALAEVGRWLAGDGGDERLLRLPMLVAGLPFVLAVGAVGRRAFGARTGAIAAAIIAGAHPFVLRGFELLGDIPATACLLGAIAIALRELADPDRPPTYHLVGIAPLCATALYLRYASSLVIALLGIAALIWFWRSIRARPGPAIATLVTFAVLVAPFAIASTRATGSPIGVLALAGDVSGRTWLGRGLLIYVFADPLRNYGVLVPIVMLAGLWALRRRDRKLRFLATIAIGQIVVLGLVSHASSRFIFVAIALLVVLGADVLDRAITRRRTLALGAIVASWLGMAIAMVPWQRHLARGLADVTASADAIRRDAEGAPCTVVARALPQLMWYSRCAGWKYMGAAKPPVDATRAWYAADTPRRPIDVGTLGVRAVPLGPAWRLEPCYGSEPCAAATP
ncbi:MAG TPA: glycosyltransferase family 39 protein [Kofleriaceae bacterium]